MTSFDSFFGDPFEAFAPLFEVRRPRYESSLEWFEDDDHYHARLDLPGVKKEDLKLEFEADIVTLSVSRTKADGSSSKYEKRVRVPENVESEGVGAKLEDGILTLSFPKAPEKKPIKIEIA